MILAVVDDLMFSSKIKTAAKQLDANIVFVRSAAAALDEMRRSRPTLVILDLNNPRTDPLGIVRTMKADPALSVIPSVGYVSHVQVDLIEEARRAGVGNVMARSMFTDQLPNLLGTFK